MSDIVPRKINVYRIGEIGSPNLVYVTFSDPEAQREVAESKTLPLVKSYEFSLANHAKILLELAQHNSRMTDEKSLIAKLDDIMGIK